MTGFRGRRQSSMWDLLRPIWLVKLKKMDESDMNDSDPRAMYDPQYPVIYVNKYTVTSSESFYYIFISTCQAQKRQTENSLQRRGFLI